MRNQKGFSLLEMMAVLFIASLVLLPLLIGLSGNIRVNNTMIDRSIASTIASNTLKIFDEMYFDDLENQLNSQGEGVLLRFSGDMEEDDCRLLMTTGHKDNRSIHHYGINQSICENVFDIESINRKFSNEEFMVFIFPAYYEDESEFSSKITALRNNDVIPNDRLKDEIMNTVIFSPSQFSFLRVLVWIQYGDNQNQAILRSALLLEPMELR